MARPAFATAVVDPSLGFGRFDTPSLDGMVILGNLDLFKLTDSSTKTLGVCMADPTWNGSGAPAGVQYLNKLIAPSIRQTLLDGGLPASSAPATVGELGILDPEGWFSGGNPDGEDYLDPDVWVWRGVTLLVGKNSYAYASFATIDSYLFIGRPAYDAESGILSLLPGPALVDLTKPAYDSLLSGFDTAVDSSDGTLHIDSGNSDQNIAADENARWFVRVQIPATGSAAAIMGTRNALTGTAAGYCLSIDASGYPVLSLGDGSNEVSITNATAIDDDNWYSILAHLDRDAGTLSGWIRQDGGAITEFSTTDADASSLGAVTNTNNVRMQKLTGGGSALTGAVDEKHFDTGAGLGYSADLRKQHTEGPGSIRETGAQYRWSMDEDNGAGVENGYDAKLRAGVFLPKSEAITGTAATREIDFGDNYDKDLTADGDSFSFTVWARITTGSVQQVLVSKKNGVAAGNAGWMMYLTSGDKLTVRLSDGTRQVEAVSVSALPIDGVWRQYGFTVGAATGVRELKVWVTDSSGATATQEGSTVDLDSGGALGDTGNADTLRLGESGAGTSPLQGDIGTAAIYSSALTQAEIERLSRIIPTKADKTTLDSCWPVNEKSGTDIYDSVGSVDGTLGAGGTWVSRNGKITPGTAANGGWIASLTGSYADGTGGTSQPQAYGGPCELVKCPVVDHRGHPYTSIDAALTQAIVYRLHHGPDALEGTLTVTVGGKVADEIGTGGNDNYYFDATNGLVYYVVDPSFPDAPVRFTYKGALFDTGATYSDRVGKMLQEILVTNGHLTSGQFPDASQSAFDSEWSYPAGIVIPGGLAEPKTIGAVLEDALPAPGLYWATDLAGDTFHPCLATIDSNAYAADIPITDDILAGVPVVDHAERPVWRVKVGYARQWNPLSDGDYLTGLTIANQQRFGHEWSYATATSSTLTAQDGREVVVHTPLTNGADAQVWAAALLDAFDSGFTCRVELSRYWWEAYLARAGRARSDVASIRSDWLPALDLEIHMSVFGVDYSPPGTEGELRVALELWSRGDNENLLHDGNKNILTDSDGVPLQWE